MRESGNVLGEEWAMKAGVQGNSVLYRKMRDGLHALDFARRVAHDLSWYAPARWHPMLAWVPVTLAFLVIAASVCAQDAPSPTADVTMAVEPPAPVQEPPVDAAAEGPGPKIFLQKCSGCHTIGKGNLSGPDLKPSSAWPRADLESKIKQMEKSVGPLEAAEIQALANLLLSGDAADRVDEAQRQIAIAQTATLEPGSTADGEALFHGRRTFVNRGVPCAACHLAGGRGGNLAVELQTSFARLGETPLKSSMENPGFPLMRAVYGAHPVTPQEAVHVTAYLKSLDGQPATDGAPPLHAAGAGGALLALAGIGIGYRNRIRGVRAQLVRRGRR